MMAKTQHTEFHKDSFFSKAIIHERIEKNIKVYISKRKKWSHLQDKQIYKKKHENVSVNICTFGGWNATNCQIYEGKQLQ